jgi:2-succinyl-5-enolpyruvyl-6-hydroxy-3-cyclohexene-1-carboxylate synthase
MVASVNAIDLVAPAAEDVQQTFCATLVDQWIRCGMTHAVIAPGSRSTPMALALVERTPLTVHIALDERSAAFIALGIGAATGVPAAVLCTSGTAATHFHAAVVEADLAGVPMLLLTADRPPELHGVGASQTIDQLQLYGTSANFFGAGVPTAGGATSWRMLANIAWSSPQPAHLNLMFREPLLGRCGELPEPIEAAERAVAVGRGELRVEQLDHARGIIVAGRGIDRPDVVDQLAAALGWPILADPRSGCRGKLHAVTAFDSLLRHDGFAADHRPDVVLHLGEPPASKVLGQWLQASGATHLQVLPRDVVIDPLGLMSHTVIGSVGDVLSPLVSAVDSARAASVLGGGSATPWWSRWRHAEERAQQAINDFLGALPALTEPYVARILTGREGPLVVSSSMPIRDVEWFGLADQRATVLANRGANGIDGVIATAIGVSAGSGRVTTALLGDVAFVHDSSSLAALHRRDVEVKMVVVDNDGGGIFSFLPQAAELGDATFERLFGTPHDTDVLGLARAHRLRTHEATTAGELRDAVAQPGNCVVRVPTQRAANEEVHHQLNAAVAAALG